MVQTLGGKRKRANKEGTSPQQDHGEESRVSIILMIAGIAFAVFSVSCLYSLRIPRRNGLSPASGLRYAKQTERQLDADGIPALSSPSSEASLLISPSAAQTANNELLKATSEPTPYPAVLTTPRSLVSTIAYPVPTPRPTLPPTSRPTPRRTPKPTPIPTAMPTPTPSAEPTMVPSGAPTTLPRPLSTPLPTPQPTLFPTPQPTLKNSPTLPPTMAPTYCVANRTVAEEHYYVFFEQFDLSVASDKLLELAFIQAYNNHTDASACEPLIGKVERIRDFITAESNLLGRQEYTEVLVLTERIEFKVFSVQTVNYTGGLFHTPVVRGTFIGALNVFFSMRQLPIYALGVKEAPLPTMAPSEPPLFVIPASTPMPTTRTPTNAPSPQPTTQAPTTPQPTPQPTAAPTNEPTAFPTATPTTPQPSKEPTVEPTTSSPTIEPTAAPTTPQPSKEPTASPTTSPTEEPTAAPTKEPTAPPTTLPPTTLVPTAKPTREPTLAPTASPTESTQNPTLVDVISTPRERIPTVPPTLNPTRILAAPGISKSPESSPRHTSPPSLEPETTTPTFSPTSAPSLMPSAQPTLHPSSSPTDAPSGHPSTAPTYSPSNSPTDAPSERPSTIPTYSPSKGPTKIPSFSPSKVPSGSPSAEPSWSSISPTSAPSSNPSKSPSHVPTYSPTNSPSSMPSRSSFPPTASPSASPSSFPSITAGGPPSLPLRPSLRPSSPPDFALKEAELNSVRMEMTGVPLLPSRSQSVWGELTERFIRNEVIERLNNRAESVDVSVILKSQIPQQSTSQISKRSASRTPETRFLQATSEPRTTLISSNLTVVFDVKFFIRAAVEDHNVRQYVGASLDTPADRNRYMLQLKSSGMAAFQSITSVRLILPLEESTSNAFQTEDDPETLGAGMTVGIAVVTVAGVALVVVGFYLWTKRRKDQSYSSSSQVVENLCEYESDDLNFNVIEKADTDVSTLGDPIPQGIAASQMDTSQAEDTTSLPYDYKVAALDLPSLDESASYSFSDMSSNIIDVQTDDDTLDAQYFVEDRIQIDAPPGMLGLVLEEDPEGVAIVYDMKELSPLADRVQIGDKLVSVDDTDVTAMPVEQVMKLIAFKQSNRIRKLVFNRPSKKSLVKLK